MLNSDLCVHWGLVLHTSPHPAGAFLGPKHAASLRGQGYSQRHFLLFTQDVDSHSPSLAKADRAFTPLPCSYCYPISVAKRC